MASRRSEEEDREVSPPNDEYYLPMADVRVVTEPHPDEDALFDERWSDPDHQALLARDSQYARTSDVTAQLAELEARMNEKMSENDTKLREMDAKLKDVEKERDFKHGLATKALEDNKQLAARIKDLEAKLAEAAEQPAVGQSKKALQTKVSNLRASVDHSNIIIDTLKGDKAHLEWKLNELTGRMTDLEQELKANALRDDPAAAASLQAAAFKEQINKAVSDAELKAARQMDELQVQINGLNDEVAQLTNGLNEERASAEKAKDQFNADLQKREEKIESLEAELDDALAQVASTEKVAEENSQQKAQFEKEVMDCRVEIETQRTELDQEIAKRKEAEAKAKDAGLLEEQRAHLDEWQAQIADSQKKLEADITKLERMATQQAQIDSLALEHADEVQNLKTEKDALSRKVKELEEDAALHTEHVDSGLRSLDILRRENHRLKQRIQALEGTSEAKSLAQELGFVGEDGEDYGEPDEELDVEEDEGEKATDSVDNVLSVTIQDVGEVLPIAAQVSRMMPRYRVQPPPPAQARTSGLSAAIQQNPLLSIFLAILGTFLWVCLLQENVDLEGYAPQGMGDYNVGGYFLGTIPVGMHGGVMGIIMENMERLLGVKKGLLY